MVLCSWTSISQSAKTQIKKKISHKQQEFKLHKRNEN